MSKLMKIDVVFGTVLVLVLFFASMLGIGAYALFHGYFDHGLFEIKQVEWSSLSPQRVAVVAARSDHEALNSDQYFVLIGDHVFSPTELRRAYYSDEVVFAAASDCLTISWSDPHHLVLNCRGDKIDAAHINVRRPVADDVTIIYSNIADSTAKEFDPA